MSSVQSVSTVGSKKCPALKPGRPRAARRQLGPGRNGAGHDLFHLGQAARVDQRPHA